MPTNDPQGQFTALDTVVVIKATQKVGHSIVHFQAALDSLRAARDIVAEYGKPVSDVYDIRKITAAGLDAMDVLEKIANCQPEDMRAETLGELQSEYNEMMQVFAEMRAEWRKIPRRRSQDSVFGDGAD